MRNFILIQFCILAFFNDVFGLSPHRRKTFSNLANDIFDITVEIEDLLKDKHHEYSLPVPDMVRGYGYTCEIHKYTTADGYINTLHRIPNSPKVKPKNQAVFLQHGLLGTSADYVMGSPEKSLGYILADLGYDVWMGNARGNMYSREHTNYSIDSKNYWKFSFDEMGKYDIPAALDYVLKNQANVTDSKAKDKKVFYIGHSMGTVMFWVAMHEHQAWMEKKIHMMYAMGPVATVKFVESPIANLAPYVKEMQVLFDLMGINEFEPTNKVMQLFDQYACELTEKELEICENVLFLLTGYDKSQMNMTMLPIILGHEPGGTSTRTLIQFAQEINSGTFQKYDHGWIGNIKHYRQPTPPQYKLDRVKVPVMLLWANNDWLADPQDVEVLRNSLLNLVDDYKVPNEQFNHIDFLWGLDAKNLVYKRIIDHMKQFKPT